MIHHGLLHPPSCVIHGPEMMRDVPGRSDIQICGFHEFSKNPCRLKRGKYEPYVSSRMKIDAGQLLRVWADIADYLTAGQIARNRCIRRKVVTKLLQDLGNAALHREENAVLSPPPTDFRHLDSSAILGIWTLKWGVTIFFIKFQYGRFLFCLSVCLFFSICFLYFCLMKVGVCTIDTIAVPGKTTRRSRPYFPITHSHQEW